MDRPAVGRPAVTLGRREVPSDRCSLDGVRLDGVRLDGVRLDGVRLDGVRLDGVRLDGVRTSAGALVCPNGEPGKRRVTEPSDEIPPGISGDWV